MRYKLNLLLFIFSILFTSNLFAAQSNLDPLPSWNEGRTKQGMLNYIKNVTTKTNPLFVNISDRIAVIDNDGTLWVEQPLYTQAIFAIDRIKALAPQHPEWKSQEPFKAILTNDFATISKFSLHDFEKIIAVTHSGMSVEDFQKIVKQWLATTKNPHFKQLYPQLIYQPMLELIQYLQANNFKVYIVTGGGQEFVRVFATTTYGIPAEQIIGTAEKTKYSYQNGNPILIKMPAIELIDDKAGKPEAINLFIGKKPLIAIGNSDGDQQMLEWTQSNLKAHYMMLIHHDDAKREFAYDTKSKIGTFSAALRAEAEKNGWVVVSMKKDWKVIFPFEERK